MKPPFFKKEKTPKEILTQRLYDELVATSEVEEFKATLKLLERVTKLEETNKGLNPAIINGVTTLAALGAIIAVELAGHTITSKGFSLIGKRLV